MRSVAFGIGMAAALGVASVTAATLDDPDAPVATARYAGPSPVDPAPMVEAEAPKPASPDRPGAFNIALDEARGGIDSAADKLSGLATKVNFRHGTPVELTRFAAPLSRIAQDQNIRRGFGEMQAVGQKARVFLFAGDQGGVVTYNFTHETTGVKAAGWTTERSDQAGERRVGFAWESGRTRVALTGMERKFCQFGSELKDRMVAMTLSIHPGWSERRDHQQS